MNYVENTIDPDLAGDRAITLQKFKDLSIKISDRQLDDR
jgi:hypothetical protein